MAVTFRRFLALLWTAVLAVSLSGNPKASDFDAVLDSLFSVTEIREVSLSPDGARVAWVQEIRNSTKGTPKGTAIYVQDLQKASVPFRVAAGRDNSVEEGIAWSADGKLLAFLSDRESAGQLQLYMKDISGGATHRLTNFKGSLADPKWSPNGKVLAVLLTEGSTGAQNPMAPKAPPLGVAEERIPEQRIVTIDMQTGVARKVSPPDIYVYEYDWSPDGRSFAADAAPGEGGDNWYRAQLYTIDAASGETRAIWKPPFQMAVPRWSPDGQSIAVVEGLMSDEGITGGDIFLIPASGGEARNLTPGMEASASWFNWLDPKRILVSESVDGQTRLATLNLDTAKISTLWEGVQTISTGGFNGALSLSRDGKIQAVVLHSFQRPPEVWVGPTGAWTQITHLNPAVQPAWGKAESLYWQNKGLRIQGWLVQPLHYDSTRRYPMVVAVHGGPSSMSRPRWPGSSNSPYIYNLAMLSYEGYFVFYPNFRGSLGQGEAFTQANVKDFGYGDFEDILRGVDQVVKSFPVDEHRIGISGWSYGGYMTMWAVTQTNRFRAAVAGAGIANWQSYYGENAIDQWLIPFFGASVYDDPAVYGRSSPLNFIKNVKTPTMMLVGERDGECPLPQSLEFWHALKTLGVETNLVVYPGEGHQIVEAEHRRDIMKRTLEWFNQHLGPN